MSTTESNQNNNTQENNDISQNNTASNNNSTTSSSENEDISHNVSNSDISNTTNFWINDPFILFRREKIFQLWPTSNMNKEEKINAITRLIILFTLFGTIVFKDLKIFVTGIATIGILILTYYILNNKSSESSKEGFSNEELYNKVKHNFTNPSNNNPLMNVLPPEIQYNPQRLNAAPSYNKAVEKEINEKTKNFINNNFKLTKDDENIKEKLFQDLGDELEFEQSMRQFYTTANTRIPNNQNEFARFCYGNMASCKDGDVEMCLKNAPRHLNI